MGVSEERGVGKKRTYGGRGTLDEVVGDGAEEHAVSEWGSIEAENRCWTVQIRRYLDATIAGS